MDPTNIKITEQDVIPPLSLGNDCCVFEGKTAKLKEIHLELPLKNIVNRLED
jgi:hypothetical protein